MRAKILGLLKIYEEEIGLLLWTAALLFIIRTSGIVLNNYAETAFLKRYGVEYMPIVNMVNAVATFFVTGFLTAFMGRMSGARLLVYVFIFSGLIITAIRLLIPFGYDLLYPLLFMLKSQFEMLQALLFWNMCNDIFNTRQSKRLFPILTAGGVVGLILGSVSTPYFARVLNMDNLLYLYLAITMTGAVLVNSMGKSYPSLIFPEKSGSTTKNKPSMAEEFKNVLPLLKESILIKIVLVLTFMPNVVIPILNYQFNYAINDQFASEKAMIQFFGYFRGGLYLISLFILLFVGRIYGRWGLPVALMFHPFNYMIAFFGFLLRFDMFSAMYARMSTNVIRTTINMPANSILIGLFPPAYRNMVRPFLRGTVVRIALFTGSLLILISDSLFHPRYLSLVALPFVMAWAGAPFFLKSRYSTILQDLISHNLLDVKGLNQRELTQIFKQGKTLDDLESLFLSARGKDVIWYGKLLKNFSPEKLDRLILENLNDRDPATQVALVKMISPESRAEAGKRLIPFIDPLKHELTIAILKLICRRESQTVGFQVLRGVDMSPFIQSDHPVVRGFAGACLYSRAPEHHGFMIDQWLDKTDMGLKQSGVIAAGLSHNKTYIPLLVGILSEKQVQESIVPDVIIALNRLDADELNEIIFKYLFHNKKKIRSAALDALEINDAATLKKAIRLLDDPLTAIRGKAREKIKTASFMDNQVLVESLGIPSSRIRRELFRLLETLDIKEFQVLLFAKKDLVRCYEYLAMAEALNRLEPTPSRALAAKHLNEKKELVLENIIRVLAIHDQTGKMQTAWRGIFSADTRQRANAVELLSDVLDKKTYNIMLPLLESPTPAVALADGKKQVQFMDSDQPESAIFDRMVSSSDWVDVVLGLDLAQKTPSLLNDHDPTDHLKNSRNPHILKEVDMILRKRNKSAAPAQTIGEPNISMGEKILLLKEIDIFAGLSAAELAAIAGVTKELDYPGQQEVIKQDALGETVFLIIDGQVEVIKELENSKEVVLDQMGPGCAFGEMALIDDSPRSATIRTLSPCRFLILHKQEFKETAMEFPRIALQICSVLSQRIRNLHSRMQEKTD